MLEQVTSSRPEKETSPVGLSVEPSIVAITGIVDRVKQEGPVGYIEGNGLSRPWQGVGSKADIFSEYPSSTARGIIKDLGQFPKPEIIEQLKSMTISEEVAKAFLDISYAAQKRIDTARGRQQRVDVADTFLINIYRQMIMERLTAGGQSSLDITKLQHAIEDEIRKIVELQPDIYGGSDKKKQQPLSEFRRLIEGMRLENAVCDGLSELAKEGVVERVHNPRIDVDVLDGIDVAVIFDESFAALIDVKTDISYKTFIGETRFRYGRRIGEKRPASDDFVKEIADGIALKTREGEDIRIVVLNGDRWAFDDETRGEFRATRLDSLRMALDIIKSHRDEIKGLSVS